MMQPPRHTCLRDDANKGPQVELLISLPAQPCGRCGGGGGGGCRQRRGLGQRAQCDGSIGSQQDQQERQSCPGRAKGAMPNHGEGQSNRPGAAGVCSCSEMCCGGLGHRAANDMHMDAGGGSFPVSGSCVACCVSPLHPWTPRLVAAPDHVFALPTSFKERRQEQRASQRSCCPTYLR